MQPKRRAAQKNLRANGADFCWVSHIFKQKNEDDGKFIGG